MKQELLTVKELAAELRMSLKSIQRAYRKEEIPVQWLGRMARFDLAKVRWAMEPNGRSRVLRLNGKSESAERDRRPRPAARTEKPPLGKTGALFLGTDDASFQQLTGRPCYQASTRTRTWGTGGPASAHLSPVWEHLVASLPLEALALPQMQDPLLGSSSPSQRVEACRQDSPEARGPERLLAGGTGKSLRPRDPGARCP